VHNSVSLYLLGQNQGVKQHIEGFLFLPIIVH